MNILDEIAGRTKARVEEAKKIHSFEEVKQQALQMNAATGFPFLQALKKEGVSLICEVKKASPSKGLIAKEFPYKEIAKDYEAGGASAISVLTEPYYFMGSDTYLKEIHEVTSLPLLRKDFVVDPYMIYEAKLLGASAVLLICAILDDKQLKEYHQIAESLGLSALVEAHDEDEINRSLQIGAKIIGVNNRNLKNFTVDINNSQKLREKIPKDVIFVSESGIREKEDVSKLREHDVDAALIGETLMRAPNRVNTVKEFVTAGRKGEENE